MDTNIDTLLQKIKTLEEDKAALTFELQETKDRLKKYTSPARAKKYYDTHKEAIQLWKKEFPVSPDKKKEYNKNYYMRKKLKEQEQLVDSV